MPTYDSEKIWERFYANLDLKGFKKAKTDKERLNEFKKAVSRDPKARNILKANKRTIEKLFNYGVAQRLIEKDKDTERSFSRFSRLRRERVESYKTAMIQGNFTEKALNKAETKGFGVREFKERKSMLGRPSKTRVVGEKVTVRQFKQGSNEYVGVWIKGRRGLVTKVKVEKQ